MTNETTDTGQNNTDAGGDDSGQQDATGDEASTLLGGGEDAGGDAGGDAGNEGDGGDSGGDGQQTIIPETYDFNLPEGVEMNDSSKESASALFKDLGLTQEGADKINSFYAENDKSTAERETNDYNDQLKAWSTELKNDPEIGGEGFDENVGKIKEFLDKTVPDGLSENLNALINSTGIGSHPSFVKYMFHLSKQFPVGEDNPGRGGASGGEASRESLLYPNDAKK